MQNLIKEQQEYTNKYQLKRKIELITKANQGQPNLFWKMKSMLERNDAEHQSVLESNNKIIDKPDELKNEYTKFYKELLTTKIPCSKEEKMAEDMTRTFTKSLNLIANIEKNETSNDEIKNAVKELKIKLVIEVT